MQFQCRIVLPFLVVLVFLPDFHCQVSSTVILTQPDVDVGVSVPVGLSFPKLGYDASLSTDFPPGTSRTGQLVSDLSSPSLQLDTQSTELPYGGECYRTRSGCQCDDGYLWEKQPQGPYYSGCANPSNDPNGKWCPLRKDVPCQRSNQGFDYCFESEDQCPEEGKPIQQCLDKASAVNIWRCVNAVRTNPKAFQQFFLKELGGAQCLPLANLQQTSFSALGGEPQLFETAQAESVERSVNASALFKATAGNSDLTLQQQMELLSVTWDMHVKVIKADWRVFSVASLASYLFCQDPNNQMYLSCGYNHIGVGLSQNALTNDIYVTLILGCPKDQECHCLK